MAIERRYLSYATAAIAIAAVPLSFFGPEGLRLAVIGLLMLAGPGTALVLLLRFGPLPPRRAVERSRSLSPSQLPSASRCRRSFRQQ